jgi:hypothetical protein
VGGGLQLTLILDSSNYLGVIAFVLCKALDRGVGERARVMEFKDAVDHGHGVFVSMMDLVLCT